MLFQFSHRMTYAGLVKMVKSHFENCNNGPEETPVQGDCSYILTPSPAGPECKKCASVIFHYRENKIGYIDPYLIEWFIILHCISQSNKYD